MPFFKFKLGDKPGSSLVLTMFILAGMLIVAMSGAYVVLLGIRAGSTQAQSTKAYYAAEAGVEDLLFKVRQQNLAHGSGQSSQTIPLVNGALQTTGAIYNVFFTYGSMASRIFTSVGDYQATKRSVEVRF